MKRWLPYVGIAAGIIIVGYALLSGSSDEDEIRERLERLEQAVAVRGEQTNLVVRGARIKDEFSDLFVKNVQIKIPELTSVGAGRTELVGLATRAPTWYQRASVDLGGLAIDVDDAKVSAHAFGDAVLTATRLGGGLERDTRTVSLRFDKIDGDWKIVSVTASEKRTDEE